MWCEWSYSASMSTPSARRNRRQRGRIEELHSGALRVSVYAGTDPLTGRRHYLREGVVNLSVADRADGREGSAGPVGDARSAGCGQAGDFVSDPEAVAHLGAVLGGRQQVATGPEVR
jgi:hypothetical protein